MIADQSAFNVRCDWGEHALRLLGRDCDAVIIVDVLSFSTTVDIATSRGAWVYPCRSGGASASALAARPGAVLAGPRSAGGYSLSPASMLGIPPGTRLALPSPNGATLSLLTGEIPTFAGCLRNARAVARQARRCGPCVAVIAAGERWPDGSLRPALEDWIGAGALLQHLAGSLSPEALAAQTVFRSVEADLHRVITATGSGTELLDAGYSQDVDLACALEASRCAPRLAEGAFVDSSGTGETRPH